MKQIDGCMSFNKAKEELAHISIMISNMDENSIGFDMAMRLRLASIKSLTSLLEEYMEMRNNNGTTE